jgi:cytochrome b561
MTDPPTHPDTTDKEADTRPPAGRPRWQVAAIAAVVVALGLTIVILHITGVLGSGSHG